VDPRHIGADNPNSQYLRAANDERPTEGGAMPPKKRAPMLLDRQERLLALLHALGGNASRLDFQKLLFLYCHEPAGQGTYEFVPYKFGAFSFTSYADCRKLTERGLITGAESEWQLTEDGTAVASRLRQPEMAAFVSRVGTLRGDKLVADTYRRFPYFAIRSEIAKRVLRGDSEALKRIDAVRPASPGPGLATIGYEGRTLESYVNVLINAGITLLCDVRRNPLSRKYGFSKSTLAKACDGVGIRYEHLPELGVASERRQGLETQADFDELFAEYEREDLPKLGPALTKIRGWIRAGARVALTCYEREPKSCHRHCVARAIERGSKRSVVAQHL
jgi:uncharacterized protein (DUF488 family)